MSGLSLKYRIPLAVIAIMLVCCMFLGSSYALWKVEFEQESENVIKTGCFDIVFENAENSESINLDKAYPISNDKGLETKPYKFTIRNNCTIDANYKLYLNVIKIDEDAAAVESNKNASASEKKTTGQIPDDNIMFVLKKNDATNSTANKITTLSQNDETTSFELDGKTLSKSYILDDGENNKGISLKANESVNYSLQLWISSEATTTINYKRFEAQLATIAYAVNTPTEGTSTD